MLEWILILVVAMLAVLAFLYLLHNTPGSSADKPASKPKKAAASRPSKQRESGDEKEKDAKRSKDKKSPRTKAEKESGGDVLVFSANTHDTEENEEDILKFFNKGNQLKVRTTEQKEEPKKKVDKVVPTQKQIDRDLQQGFVLVTKKGAKELSPEQRLERAETRRAEKREKEREDEEQRQRQKKAMERKLRGNSPPAQPQDKPQAVPIGLVELRNKKEEVKPKKTEPMKITVYNTPKVEGEPPKIWSSLGAPQLGGEVAVDEQIDADYPRL